MSFSSPENKRFIKAGFIKNAVLCNKKQVIVGFQPVRTAK
jgi:hypothetical protein